MALRRIGPRGRARAKRLRAICPYIRTREGGRCWWCGEVSSRMDVHHVIKRSQGGSDDPANLVLLCRFPCHDRTDWAYSRGKLVIRALGEEKFVGAIVQAPDKATGKTREAQLLRMAEMALQG